MATDITPFSSTIMSETLQRPQFLPSHICTEYLRKVSIDDGLANWLPVINCPAGFVSDIVSHPSP